MDTERNYAAEMADYLERAMSAALQLQPSPSQNASSVLAMLSDLVRRGTRGAFEALCQQLRPILISLAAELQPDDPHDLAVALYQAVMLRKKSSLTYIENDIRTTYRNLWRGRDRERRKVAHLSLVHPQSQQAFTPGEVSILLKYLNDQERHLWIGVSEGKPIPMLAEELGWGVKKTEAQWAELQQKLKETLASERE